MLSELCDKSLEDTTYHQRTTHNWDKRSTKYYEGCHALQSPRIFVEGPYGSSMENITRHKIAVCIAGGIGITPFAAVINFMR